MSEKTRLKKTLFHFTLYSLHTWEDNRMFMDEHRPENLAAAQHDWGLCVLGALLGASQAAKQPPKTHFLSSILCSLFGFRVDCRTWKRFTVSACSWESEPTCSSFCTTSTKSSVHTFPACLCTHIVLCNEIQGCLIHKTPALLKRLWTWTDLQKEFTLLFTPTTTPTPPLLQPNHHPPFLLARGGRKHKGGDLCKHGPVWARFSDPALNWVLHLKIGIYSLWCSTFAELVTDPVCQRMWRKSGSNYITQLLYYYRQNCIQLITFCSDGVCV